MKDIAKFIAGFERFQVKYFHEERELFSQLREAQRPRALVISCCDSRVDPAMLTGAEPGDLFVVRNVANLVPPYAGAGPGLGMRAAIEFAVRRLTVEHIIVLGHARCGGIQALMDGDSRSGDQYEFVGEWVSIGQRARDRVLGELAQKPPSLQAKACEQAAILVSLDNLLSYPWIRERVEKNLLTLHGWYFDIESGDLLAYSAEAAAFVSLVSRPAGGSD